MIHEINRRDFLKVGTVGAATFSLGAIAQANANKQIFKDSPEFLDIFEKIDCTDGTRPKFPLILTHNRDNHPDIIDSDWDYIVVKPYTIEKQSVDEVNQTLYEHAALTLLAAATDRNIVVYDSSCTKNIVNSRLCGLITKTMSRNYNCINGKLPITDVFCRANKVPAQTNTYVSDDGSKVNYYFGNKVVWHPIKNETWDFLENCYKHELGGTFPNGKNNLLLVLSNYESTGEFVHPITSSLKRTKGGKYAIEAGIGVLNNKRLLLGAF